jgi:ribosome-binding protein aMBF1 (putative translation factor)
VPKRTTEKAEVTQFDTLLKMELKSPRMGVRQEPRKRKRTMKPVAFVDVNGKSCASFVKWFRENRNLSLRGLAAIVGRSNGFISQVESGRHPLPLDFMKELYKIADAKERLFLLDCVYSEMNNFLDHET